MLYCLWFHEAGPLLVQGQPGPGAEILPQNSKYTGVGKMAQKIKCLLSGEEALHMAAEIQPQGHRWPSYLLKCVWSWDWEELNIGKNKPSERAL